MNDLHTSNATAPATGLIDQAASSAEQGLHSMRRMTEQAEALAQRGLDSARLRSHELADQAHRVSDRAAEYVRHDPLKAVLIAAAAGAGIVALATLLRRRAG